MTVFFSTSKCHFIFLWFAWFLMKSLLLFFSFLNFILSIFLYSRFLLVICFIHIVYICQSQSPNASPCPPPPLSPLGVHRFVLYICVSISACKLVHLYYFSRFHIYALIYDICFSLLLLSTLILSFLCSSPFNLEKEFSNVFSASLIKF